MTTTAEIERAHAPHWHTVEAGGIVYAQGQCAGLEVQATAAGDS